MSLSLMWRVMLFTWTNVLMFIGLSYIVLQVFVKPFGFKEATPLLNNKLNKTSKQEEIYPLYSEDDGLNGVYGNPLDLEVSDDVNDGFLPNFNKRIEDLKRELGSEDEYDGIPEDLRGSFYVYPEDEEYVPDMFDPDSGVEIITDAYEKRIEDRLK